MTDWRAVSFWVVGAVLVFFGSLIAGSVDPSALGSTTLSVAFAYIIALVLILVGGMFWISTAVMQIEES